MRKMILVLCAGLGCQAKSLINDDDESLSDAAIEGEAESESEAESEAEAESESEGEDYTCTTDECGDTASPGRRNNKDCFCNATTLEPGYDDWCADSKEAFCRTCPEECSMPHDDAGPDVSSDAGEDAPPDAGPDVGPDLGPDAQPDAGPDSGSDAGPDGDESEAESEAEAEAESEGECNEGWVARESGRDAVLEILARGFPGYPDGMPCAALVGDGPLIDRDRGLAVARSVIADGASVYGFPLEEMAEILGREAVGVYSRVTYVGLPEGYCREGEYLEVTDFSEAVVPDYIGPNSREFLACYLSEEARTWLCRLNDGDGCGVEIAFEYSTETGIVPLGVEVCADPVFYGYPPRERTCTNFHPPSGG